MPQVSTNTNAPQAGPDASLTTTPGIPLATDGVPRVGPDGTPLLTDQSPCCCGGDGCCTPLASCLVLTACSSPLESCTNGCTLLPGSIARVNSFSASYSSGNVIRSVSFSGATLKACGNLVGFSGTVNLSVTLKGGRFGRTYTVPVCWSLLTTDGNIWGMDVQGGSFDVTDSSGTGDTYTIKTVPFVFDDTFSSPIIESNGCGTCEGYPVPTISGSRVMAFYVTHKNGVPNSALQPSTTATRANWSGSTNFDVFGTLSTDAKCNGCPADVYYVWQSCRDADAIKTVWARAEGCAQAPFACQTVPTNQDPVTGFPKCLSYTGQTVPSTSIPPAGVLVWPGSICGDATRTPPTYTCCKCLSRNFGGCCEYIDIPMALSSTLTNCPCHESLSATITHTGGGTAYYSGQPHTIVFEGSYTAIKTGCGGWNTVGGSGRSIISGPLIDTDYPVAPNNGAEWQVGWTPFNCGSVGDTGSCVVTEQTCNRFVTVQTFNVPGFGSGTHIVTVDITINEGACKSTPCSGGAGGLTASGYDGSIASLMRFFKGVR